MSHHRLCKPDLAEFGGRIIQDEVHGQFDGGNVGHGYHDWRLIVARRLARATAVQIDERPKRRRKLSLAAALKAADKAGKHVNGAVVEPGKITLTFGEPTPTDANNPWLVELDKVTKQ